MINEQKSIYEKLIEITAGNKSMLRALACYASLLSLAFAIDFEYEETNDKKSGILGKSDLLRNMFVGAIVAVCAIMKPKKSKFLMHHIANSIAIPANFPAFSINSSIRTFFSEENAEIQHELYFAVVNAEHSAGIQYEDVSDAILIFAEHCKTLDNASKAIAYPVWSGSRISPTVQKNLKDLADLQDSNFQILIDWYMRVLEGDRSQADLIERAALSILRSSKNKIPDNFTLLLTERVRFIKEHARLHDATFTDLKEAPAIPPPQPAAIEPIISQNMVRLPSRSSPSDLKGATLNAALRALKDDFSRLADDASSENIDRRAVEFLRSVGQDLPESAPKQQQLFRIAHKIEALETYSNIVSAEWSPILAARYLAAARAYDRTMRQFPKWRKFLVNLERDILTPVQIAQADFAASAFAEASQKDDVVGRIDPDVITALKSISVSENTFVENHMHYEARSIDMLTSLNNILKLLATVTLESFGLDIARNTTNYANAFQKSFSTQLKKEGQKAGKQFASWSAAVFRGIVTASISGGGIIFAQYLSVNFPHYFNWLLPVVTFLGTTWASKKGK